MSIFIHHGASVLEIRSPDNENVVASEKELTEYLDRLIKETLGQQVLYTLDVNDTLLRIRGSFEWIEASGGLIKDQADHYLLIYRRGHWDLPKGKIDAGESPREAAVREIEEETGVNGLVFQQELPPSYHIYPFHQKWVLKKTHWFLYKANSAHELRLQQEEDIEQAQWMSASEIRKHANQIYSSLMPLLNSVIS